MSTEIELTREEYQAVQDQVQAIARIALTLNPEMLDAFIRQAEIADTAGPFVDPTAWQAGHARLRVVIDHARAVRELRKVVAR